MADGRYVSAMDESFGSATTSELCASAFSLWHRLPMALSVKSTLKGLYGDDYFRWPTKWLRIRGRGEGSKPFIIREAHSFGSSFAGDPAIIR